MAKEKLLVAFLLVAAIAVAGCVAGDKLLPDGSVQKADGTIVKANGVMVKPDGTMLPPEGSPAGTIVNEDGTVIKPDGTMVKPDGTMAEPENKTAASAAGTGSAGSGPQTANFDGTGLTKLANNYYRYEPAAYQRALDEKRVVFLNFRANWCPICNLERPGILAGMNAINYPDVVGFEAHYNDGETTQADNDLIRRHQVAYQHTKIIVDKNGNVALKTLEGFDRARTAAEIEKARAA